MINLTEDMKDLYNKNYKTLLKEVNDINKWKNIQYSWIERHNIVKISIQSKAILRFSVTSIKIPMMFSTKIGKSILKFMWNLKGPQILKRRIKLQDSHLLISKLLQSYSNQNSEVLP